MFHRAFPLVSMALLLLLAPDRYCHAATTAKTTDPSYLVNVSGLKNSDDLYIATVAVGGHIRGTMSYATMMGQPVKAYSFSMHDNAADGCDSDDAGSHQGQIRIKGISNAGTLGTTVWYQSRFYTGTDVHEKDPFPDPLQHLVFNNADERLDIITWDPTPQRSTSWVFQFKVGIWQGDQNNWTSRAATPGL